MMSPCSNASPRPGAPCTPGERPMLLEKSNAFLLSRSCLARYCSKANVSGIHLLFDLNPFLSWASNLNGTIAHHLASGVSWPPSIDEGSCIGRILDHLIHGRLRGVFPEQLPSIHASRLATGKQDACLTKHAHDLATTPVFIEAVKDKFNGMAYPLIGIFHHTAIIQTHQSCWQHLAELPAVDLASSPGIQTIAD